MKKVLGLVLSSSLILGFGSTLNASAAPASPISTVYVSEVRSDQGGTEYLSPGQFVTKKDHGGNIRVTTTEYGYGKNRFAEMGGDRLKQMYSYNLVQFNTIVGQEITWDASYYSNGGYFTYEVTSQNAPWNTERISLNIQ
jgi:hypothetical protein